VSEKLLEKAFTLGFMVSREGFNAECAYEHCAPGGVQAHYETIAEFMDAIEKNKRFVALRKSAVKANIIDRINAPGGEEVEDVQSK